MKMENKRAAQERRAKERRRRRNQHTLKIVLLSALCLAVIVIIGALAQNNAKKEAAAKKAAEQNQTSVSTSAESRAEPKYITDAGTEVKDGDTVNIDYVGKIDGAAFRGGTDSGYDLALGSHSFIEGFEEQIVGHKVGETFDIDVTFPDDYNSTTTIETDGGTKEVSLAGTPATFTVTINGVYQ